jgi:hypothetical protein
MGTKTVELGDILDLIITVCDILVLKLNGSTTALAFDSQEFPMIIVGFKNDDVTFSIANQYSKHIHVEVHQTS